MCPVLHFEYKMEINYEEYISRCFFTIKCIPREDARQHLLGIELSVLPETEYSMGRTHLETGRYMVLRQSLIISFYFSQSVMWRLFRQIMRRSVMRRQEFSGFLMANVYQGLGFRNIINLMIFQNVRALMKSVWHGCTSCIGIFHMCRELHSFIPERKKHGAWEEGLPGLCAYLCYIASHGRDSRSLCMRNDHRRRRKPCVGRGTLR